MQIYGRNFPGSAIQTLAEKLNNVNIGLRWGGPKIGEWPKVINSQATLLNGLEQLQTFQKANLPCVEFTTELEQAQKWLDDRLIVFARKLFHTQGKDIIILDPYKGIPAGFGKGRRRRDFYSLYKPSLSEWRFHICKNPQGEYVSIARGKKVFVPSENIPEVDGLLIRSRSRGWHLSHTEAPSPAARDLAKKAVAALGYDLGAVDLIEIAKGKFALLEVNSRPAIRDDYTIAHYEKAFQSLAKI